MLAAIRGGEWVAGIAEGRNVVKVSVADVRVQHEVKLMDRSSVQPFWPTGEITIADCVNFALISRAVSDPFKYHLSWYRIRRNGGRK
jgi:hypothetical protein